jgi:hypothetical protein
MQIVPERNDQGKPILILLWLPVLGDAPFANHPMIWGTESAGFCVSEVETGDVYFHQHALQRQGWSIYNRAGSLRRVIAGPFPFALRHLFSPGSAVDGPCVSATSFSLVGDRRVGLDEPVVESKKVCICRLGVCRVWCGMLSLSLGHGLLRWLG